MSDDLEILALVDALDDLIHNAKPVPLTDQVRIDKENVYELLDRMRAAAPEAIRRARETDPPAPEPAGDPAPEPPSAAAAAVVVDVEEAARTLVQLVERVKFGGETIRIEAHGIPMAELRPPPL